MSTLTLSKNNKSLGLLVLAEAVKKQVPLTQTEGSSTSISLQDGVTITGASAVMRYLGRAAPAAGLYGQGILQQTEVDHWLDFSVTKLACTGEYKDALQYLNTALSPVTFLVGQSISLADYAVIGALRGSNDFVKQYSAGTVPHHVLRYYNFLLTRPEVKTVMDSLPAIAAAEKKPKAETSNQVKKERKEEGKFVELPGAKEGEVVVRFPPEASGFLHIGHAKAALLNQYYQNTFKGTLIMRFDDTNPAKENLEFERVILEDIAMLGLKPDVFTHTSDSFDLIMDYCTKLIREGKAYVDDTDAETMKQEREERVESKNRNLGVEQHLAMWEEMKIGSEKGLKCCVRAKMDMKSDNGCLRDPAIFRCKLEPHVRTGDKYKAYPTYDFACPIVDSVEGVTHALRTTEYHDRDDQYYWFIEALGLRKPYVWAYSRLNLQNTVMSKRKLTWFVEQGLVEGWEDPRFPTVRGVLRRGMTVEGLKEFVIAQGSSRSVNMMDWDKIWSFNKKVIDPVVPRYTALAKDSTVMVTVSGAVEEVKQVAKHPKNENVGTKPVWYSSRVYVDRGDADVMHVGENVTFVNWGNLQITNIVRNAAGQVESVQAETNLSNTDYKKTMKITWLAETSQAPFTPAICVDFDHIITKGILSKEDDFKDFINRNSRHETVMVGDPELRKLKKGDMIQLQRRGFFICDAPYETTSRHSGRESPCILLNIPDGHTKEMHKSGSKHKDLGVISKEQAQSKRGKQAEKSPQEEVAPAAPSAGDAASIDARITEQGNLIRQMKEEKKPKSEIEPVVKVLLSLKKEYKSATGKEWKPGQTPVATQAAKSSPVKEAAPSGGDAASLDARIAEQGNLVRKLKEEKKPKSEIDPAVKVLLSLKKEYKSATGKEWKPGQTPAATQADKSSPVKEAAPSGGDAASLDARIAEQGNLVRKLKEEKKPKSEIDPAVKVLLSLKKEYKSATGKEWKPGQTPAATQGPSDFEANTISDKIAAQGDKIRDLKAQKTPKAQLDPEVKVLLSLKAEYKTATGQEWKPGSAPSKPKEPSPAKVTMPAATGGQEVADLKTKIDTQGTKVRELKSATPQNKDAVDAAVKELLSLKQQYKTLTGEDLSGGGGRDKKGKKDKSKGGEKPQGGATAKPQAADSREVKKVTRLGMEAKKEDNLSEWYSQVITKGELIEYYDVSGCYVFRPWSFAIWESISRWFDDKIKEIGFENCYFPMFVSHSALEKEKEHIEDFAPEVAWVTKSGQSELAEPIAIRPTSETVMYPSYSKWVQSHRDLPIKLNQWCSVVRWEFKHPQPFLRTREFLWQEGHSAYATYAEAEKEVYHIIDLYEEIYETLLAIPVIKGRKTQKEKFAGGDFTTTVEAYISASGRGIQAATSHHLGQNFSKMFDISFEQPDSHEKGYAYQNSWAITTRSIGVIVMVHGDNKGLVLPPRIASVQCVIVPCGVTAQLKEADKQQLISKCEELTKSLRSAGVKVREDYRDHYSPGWKFNHWELKGVPIRIELGPQDLKKGQFIAVRRDTGEKVTFSLDSAQSSIKALLEQIHHSMFDKVKKDLDAHVDTCFTFDDFCNSLDKKNVILAPFCGEIPCEDVIKKQSARDAVVEEGAPAMGAKGLCIPFKQPADIKDSDKCIGPECTNKPKFYTLFGRSY